MTAVHYRPSDGGWVVAVRPDAVFAIERGAGDVDGYWAALRSDDPVDAIVTQIAAGGLAAMPAFALLAGDADGGRLIVRGTTATIGADEVDASRARTWTERAVPAGATVSLRFADADADADGDLLPVDQGIVLAAAVEVRLGAPGVAPIEPPKVPVAKVPAKQAVPEVAPPAELADEPDDGSVSEHTIVPEHTVVPEAAPGEADEGGYDHLFGETIVRSVEAAAQRPEEEVEPALERPSEGDHAGDTVLGTDLASMRAQHATDRNDAPTRFLELGAGERVELDGPVVVGRAPSSGTIDGRIPQLVTIPGDKDISRNHVRIAVQGDTVVVTDLDSRNGTIVVAPGKKPQQLRRGEPTVVLPDTVIDLGGGTTMVVREH